MESPMIRPLLITGLLVAVLGFAGCGNKGPLYLPPADTVQGEEETVPDEEQ
jgi:predicted small lipoprotein YifL